MFASVTSAAFVGVEPCAVRVEAHVSGMGKGSFSIVGLPDAAVREARERVRSAMLASGFPFPAGRVTVNLAPADLPKVGSAYDLPIAFGLLAAARTIPPRVGDVVALGELALDGAVRGRAPQILVGSEIRPMVRQLHAASACSPTQKHVYRVSGADLRVPSCCRPAVGGVTYLIQMKESPFGLSGA